MIVMKIIKLFIIHLLSSPFAYNNMYVQYKELPAYFWLYIFIIFKLKSRIVTLRQKAKRIVNRNIVR